MDSRIVAALRLSCATAPKFYIGDGEEDASDDNREAALSDGDSGSLRNRRSTTRSPARAVSYQLLEAAYSPGKGGRLQRTQSLEKNHRNLEEKQISRSSARSSKRIKESKAGRGVGDEKFVINSNDTNYYAYRTRSGRAKVSVITSGNCLTDGNNNAANKSENPSCKHMTGVRDCSHRRNSGLQDAEKTTPARTHRPVCANTSVDSHRDKQSLESARSRLVKSAVPFGRSELIRRRLGRDGAEVMVPHTARLNRKDPVDNDSGYNTNTNATSMVFHTKKLKMRTGQQRMLRVKSPFSRSLSSEALEVLDQMKREMQEESSDVDDGPPADAIDFTAPQETEDEEDATPNTATKNVDPAPGECLAPNDDSSPTETPQTYPPDYDNTTITALKNTDRKSPNPTSQAGSVRKNSSAALSTSRSRTSSTHRSIAGRSPSHAPRRALVRPILSKPEVVGKEPPSEQPSQNTYANNNYYTGAAGVDNGPITSRTDYSKTALPAISNQAPNSNRRNSRPTSVDGSSGKRNGSLTRAKNRTLTNTVTQSPVRAAPVQSGAAFGAMIKNSKSLPQLKMKTTTVVTCRLGSNNPQLTTKEKTFEVTPAGYDVRISEPLIHREAMDVPMEIKMKADEKCREWLNKWVNSDS